ncbi:MAG: hypothetical protein U5R14_08215 [Gemmatimonadota bacterium]|nr:hypothetical protein [Gemmatimonadota bacterium]
MYLQSTAVAWREGPLEASSSASRWGGRAAGIALGFLLLCVVSRVATTVYTIEDPDSLRFALSLREYSIPDLQPHFPGYPVFAFLGKLLYLGTGSFAASFSLLGAVAVFGIVFYLLRILELELDSLRGGLVAASVFFNPLVWLMSNRYMPDLLGVALALGAFYHLMVDEGRHGRAIGLFGTGLLAGLRLSYLPFLLPPVVAALVKDPRQLRAVGWGLAGVIVWLVPLLVLTGPAELMNAAVRQTQGHFADFGGTIMTEPDTASRSLRLVESIWADGLGGYWWGRHPVTLLVSAGVVALLPVGLRAGRRVVSGRMMGVMAASWGTYLIWIALYQNVIHKSRHVLPLLPFVLLPLALGAARVVEGWGRSARAALVAVGLAYVTVTGVLVIQHREPTAIAQVVEYLREQEQAGGAEVHVFSIPLANFYFSAQGVSGTFLSAEDPTDVEALEELVDGGGPARLVSVGGAVPFGGLEPSDHTTFYHNPYVNRMWPEVEVYEYVVEP